MRQHTTYFDIQDRQFQGADSLIDRLTAAQFVALGEIHDSARMSAFTTALLSALRPHGFQNWAIETGPHAATKLQQLAKEGRGAVTAFYDTYASKLFDLYPIPFFKGQSDLDMLLAADSLGYELWGLDQEFRDATAYLIDELERLQPTPLTVEQADLQSSLHTTLYWWNRRAQLFSDFPLSCRVQSDEDMKRYLATFDRSTPALRRLLDTIEVSLDIYCQAERGEWSASNAQRIAYFKANFDAQYRRAALRDSLPKVVVKMGSYHSGRERSPLNIHDLGHHLDTLATANGTRSVHLRFLNRYFDGGEDYIGREGWSSYPDFMRMGTLERWALIDLRPLRRLYHEGRLQMAPVYVREVQNYDFLIVMPDDHKVVKHY